MRSLVTSHIRKTFSQKRHDAIVIMTIKNGDVVQGSRWSEHVVVNLVGRIEE